MTGDTAALDAAAASVQPGAPATPVHTPTPRKRYASLEEMFADRTIEVEGGHLHWTGATGARGTPVVAHQCQVDTAYRLSFRWHHGRAPEGNVRPTCGYPCCVAGGHLADRVMREGGLA
ncbi:hypothetical protein HUT18_11915 [Streptomyces sp. NA04227]|uniref:hypothetical protein n=1 Tax=Streptomyces sp. NA04227 TaxID=2742136 RepID=UPI0015915E0E|nr:hypothetical protein [Streptomyces sp. NA04227]QKW07004.1 hypothetical protein HUT18_11915 [Streptomyces sp. NA04227]